MSAHADAEFQSRNGFCRTDCDECDRLDREELAGVATSPDVLAKAFDMAVEAAVNEFGIPRDEAEALTREAMGEVITKAVDER